MCTSSPSPQPRPSAAAGVLRTEPVPTIYARSVPDLDSGLGGDQSIAHGGHGRADHPAPVPVAAVLGEGQARGGADRVADLVLDVATADVAVVGTDGLATGEHLRVGRRVVPIEQREGGALGVLRRDGS